MEYLIILAVIIAAVAGVVALKARKEAADAPKGTGGPRSGADKGDPKVR